jgi:hypothetical protein
MLRARNILSLFALALALAALPGCNRHGTADEGAAAQPARVTMQIVAIDDMAAPFETPTQPLPRGVSMFDELVADPTQGARVVHYARIVLDRGETQAAAIKRVEPWLAAHPLPPGRRFGFGEIIETDDATGKSEVVGLRTYVFEGDAALTEADVAEAKVEADDGTGPVRTPSIAISLTTAGTERFRAFTAAHVQKRAAILLDGMVRSAPLIQTEIGGGKVRISGFAGQDPEKALAEVKRVAAGLKGKAAP